MAVVERNPVEHAEPASIPAEDVVSIRAHKEKTPLYADRVRVYPKKIDGTFRRLKWAILAFCLAVYYIAPWIRWDRGPNAPGQALLVDLPGRRAYFLWLEIWPQEVYFLTGLLVLGAFALFLATSLFGRVWCGYACPQTVWTDLFMLVERLIEGDRNARIKLDKSPLSLAKVVKKAAKHGSWLVIAAATGGAWVLYFQDAPTAMGRIFTGEAAVSTYFFIGLFTATTYLLAGWAREQVCTYMCPWPRFQSAMLDEQSIIVTYEKWRGEPRGKLKAGSAEKLGDCIDCNKCVAVCPTGIDIRDGLQLECIGCGLCIDACNTVMAQIGRPTHLITFDTLANQAAEAAGGKAVYKPVRARTLFYASALVLVGVIMAGALALRTHLDVTVLHERNPLFVTLSGGDVRNGYTIKILNKTHDAETYRLSLEGVADYQTTVVGLAQAGDAAHPLNLTVPPDSVGTYRLYLTIPHATVRPGESEATFRIQDEKSGEEARHESIFIAPKQPR